ncbi:hypothetical protein LDFHOB_02055 [Candidatus Electronema aureum]
MQLIGWLFLLMVVLLPMGPKMVLPVSGMCRLENACRPLKEIMKFHSVLSFHQMAELLHQDHLERLISGIQKQAGIYRRCGAGTIHYFSVYLMCNS